MKYYILKPQNIDEFLNRPSIYEVSSDQFFKMISDTLNSEKMTKQHFEMIFRTVMGHLFCGQDAFCRSHLLVNELFCIVEGHGIKMLPEVTEQDFVLQYYVRPAIVPFDNPCFG